MIFDISALTFNMQKAKPLTCTTLFSPRKKSRHPNKASISVAHKLTVSTCILQLFLISSLILPLLQTIFPVPSLICQEFCVLLCSAWGITFFPLLLYSSIPLSVSDTDQFSTCQHFALHFRKMDRF